MALCLSKSVVRCEVDNREPGRVTGELWLLGRPTPVTLTLRGNGLRDLAGRCVVVENPAPEPGDAVGELLDVQEGPVGEMTVQHTARALDCSVEEARTAREAGRAAPSHVRTGVYLEWFSANGRVVVEGPALRVASCSDAAWTMTDDQEAEQLGANHVAVRDWLSQLGGSRSRAAAAGGDADDEPGDGSPMDEFAWERGLKESDALTDKYMQAMEKFRGHPDRQKLVAREMGWTWMEEALDAQDRGALSDEGDDPEDSEAPDEPEPLVPNPETEGVDWIQTADGEVRHPLADRALDLAVDVLQRYQEHFHGEKEDEDVCQLLFQTELLSAKLSGALDSLAYDDEPEGGFVVACLKRALRIFDAAHAACDRVSHKFPADRAYLAGVRTELFAIRTEMLALMQRYRKMSF